MNLLEFEQNIINEAEQQPQEQRTTNNIYNIISKLAELSIYIIFIMFGLPLLLLIKIFIKYFTRKH